MKKPLCIYHGNCADGFTSAWVVRQALGDGVEFHAGVYQNAPPDVEGRDVVMVDFSYKRPACILDDKIADAAFRQLQGLGYDKIVKRDANGVARKWVPEDMDATKV